MKIQEAIEAIESEPKMNLNCATRKYLKGVQLGAEALKRLKEHREEHIDIGFRYLPGETSD